MAFAIAASSGEATVDESTRFILPADAPLLSNLAALWLMEPGLAAELEALDEATLYQTEPAKDGDATIGLPGPNGRVVYLHSRYHPVDEASRLIDSAEVQDKSVFYVLGFGLGYHVDALAKQIGEEALVCVMEPDLRMLRAGLGCRDVSKLINSRRLLILWKADKSELLARLTTHAPQIALGYQTIIHAPSLQLQREFFEHVQQWIGELDSYIHTSVNTLVLNSTKTAENVAANIGWYAASGTLARLKDRYAKSPAIIVSAGPSLRKNKHLLAGLEDRAVLIAVQTTLQPLLDMGVRPRFVTSLDYHEICSRFFENLPRKLETELVAEVKATEAIFRLNPGPLTMLGNEFAEGLLREISLNKPKLRAGATVAHLAYYLAEHMGCDPIIFIGQDLGFSDGLCYAPGTSYEDVWRPELTRYCTVEMKQWEQIVRERPILRRIRDVDGRAMYTEERLFMYLQQFERDFSESQATIIDATEGGALKRGAKPMALAEAIERYCQNPLPAERADHPGLNWDNLPRCIECLENRRDEARQIGRICEETLPLLEEIVECMDNQAQVNRLIARIDQLRADMDKLGRAYNLLMQLTQQTEYKRFERDLKLAASKASGFDKQRGQVERDIENVKAVQEAGAAFAKLMDETIARLRAQVKAGEIACAA
jgi:hypothetical protein